MAAWLSFEPVLSSVMSRTREGHDIVLGKLLLTDYVWWFWTSHLEGLWQPGLCDREKGPEWYGELIIKMVVKGTGKEKTWRGKVIYNRNIQISEMFLYQRRIMTVSKNNKPVLGGLLYLDIILCSHICYIYIYIARQVSSLFCRWWNWGSERHSNMFKVTQLFSDVTIKTKVRLIPKPVIQIVLTYSRWRSKETDLRGQEGEANYLSHSREGGL